MSPDEPAAEPFDAGRLAALERACELGLRAHFAGFELVDRRLELGPTEAQGRHVDLLGIDGSGRSILISFSDGASDETALVALESVALARHHGELLAQHVRAVRGATASQRSHAPAPLSVLIAESFSPRLLQKLALVPARELAFFEVAELKSGARTTVAFRPVGSARAAASAEQFLAALTPEARTCAELLVRRLPRIDERFVCTPSEESLVWRTEESDVCRVERSDGELLAWDAAATQPTRLRTPADVADLLERVIRGSRALAEKPVSEPERAPVQLLTAEELAAFRDP